MASTYEINNSPINQGALAGRYALKDFSNSEKFSNIINAIPIRFKFICTGNTIKKLTLVEGSTLTFLDGTSDTNSDTPLYDYYTVTGLRYGLVTLDTDISLTINFEGGDPGNRLDVDNPLAYNFVVYNGESKQLEFVTNKGYNGDLVVADWLHGTTHAVVHLDQTGSESVLEFNKEANYMKGPGQGNCSVPLGYFDNNWDFHAFHALGFYGQMFWVDKDVEYLIPAGKTSKCTMNVENVSTDRIRFTYFDGADGHNSPINASEVSLVLYKDGSVISTEKFTSANSIRRDVETCYLYLTADNYVYSVTTAGSLEDNTKIINATKQNCVKLCDVSTRAGLFNGIVDENMYQAANLKEIKADVQSILDNMVHNSGKELVAGDKTFVDVTTLDHAVIKDLVIPEGGKGVVEDGGNFTFEGLLQINQSLDDLYYVEQQARSGAGYDGTKGGVWFNSDAYINAIEVDNNGKCIFNTEGSDARNCLNIVGGSNAAEGGVILGRFKSNGNKITQMTKLYGKDGNLVVQAKKILPENNTSEIGDSGTRRFKTIYSEIFDGTATRARWADLAEMYKTDEEYPIGTLVTWGGTEEMTIADEEVHAVISEKPAYLMNDGLEGGQPIALAGRVRVRVVDTVKKFDKIYLSAIPGVGTVYPRRIDSKAIARALEDKDTEGEGLVLCAVHFSI